MSAEEQPISIQENVEQVWARIRENSPIYNFALSSVKITSVSKGHVIATLRVEPNHLNSKNTLHGTVTTCIIDWMGSMVIASHGLQKTGVSTDIHASFVGFAAEGEELIIEGRSEKIGRSLAFVSVLIQKVKEGGEKQVVSKGSHTKYIN
ncbi:thioesterase family protein [Choiromyces venosus 120613-1]|uniref:Thioesterase family protein n=1 Tax=Choiromyces venosus 120613-1 TaxID=1336337 RepID=A0A3N4JVV8_9PEZI|nr:thioesterase family protein [Choiromyces venosus 120613-1]